MIDFAVGDIAYFLSDYDLIPCSVVAVNKKSVKVRLPSFKGCIQHDRNVPREKLVGQSTPFCVVWDRTKGRNGRGSYRIERMGQTVHPVRLGWRPTTDYVQVS